MNKFVVPLMGETLGGDLKEVGEAVISLCDGVLLIDRVTFQGWSSEQMGLRFELMMTTKNLALKAINIADRPTEEEEHRW